MENLTMSKLKLAICIAKLFKSLGVNDDELMGIDPVLGIELNETAFAELIPKDAVETKSVGIFNKLFKHVSMVDDFPVYCISGMRDLYN